MITMLIESTFIALSVILLIGLATGVVLYKQNEVEEE